MGFLCSSHGDIAEIIYGMEEVSCQSARLEFLEQAPSDAPGRLGIRREAIFLFQSAERIAGLRVK